MTTLQERRIAEQKTYLDMVTASEPYRRVMISDRINARAELAALRAQAAQAEALRARVTSLEKALEQARTLIDICVAREDEGHTQNPHMVKRLRAWLAAHPRTERAGAPAQPEQEQAG